MFKLGKRFSSNSIRSTINTIGVVGAGQMGLGIGLTGALIAKKNIIFYDASQNQLKLGEETILEQLNKQKSKGKITDDDMSKILSNIKYSTNLTDFKDTDFVIEAVTENKDIKKEIFSNLNKICDEDVILSTNTSTIPINQIASYTNNNKRFELVCGMHFMNPVLLSKLIEIIPSEYTNNEVINVVKNLCSEYGKVYSESKDVVGFIANRILLPYINEAIYVLYENIATKEDIDKTMKLGTNIPMGPIELCDFIGVDTCLFIQETIYNEMKNEKYRVCPLLYDMVKQGKLGCKTGQGFYQYEKPGSHKKKELVN